MRRLAVLLTAATTFLSAVGLVLARTPVAPAVRAPGWMLAALGLLGAGLYGAAVVRVRRTRGTRIWLAAAILAPLSLGCALWPAARSTDAVVPGADGVRLAATLYLPPGEGPHPGVVLVHGSTRQTRDGLFGLYRSVAEGLAERGVAALVYDKRGCGASTGDYESALFDELSGDAAAALDWLAGRAEIDATRVGLWGISQGGWVGTLAAERSERARLLVLVSAPMAPEGEQRLFEWMQRLRRDGVPAEHREEAARLQGQVWEYYGTGEGWEEVSAAWERARGEPWWFLVEGLERGGPAPPEEVRSAVGRASLRWQRTDRVFDPRPVLAELDLPVLAFYGGRDEIVPMPESYERASAILAARGDGLSEARLCADARHPLLELTPLPRFPKGYLDATAAWIEAVTR